MKKFLAFVFSLVLVPCAIAQGTGTVSGTVTDSSAINWRFAAVTFNLSNPQGGQAINTVTGLPVPIKVNSFANSTATLSQLLVRNDNIVPYGTAWIPTICTFNPETQNPFNGSGQCQTLQPFVLNSSTLDLSSNISVQLTPFNITPGFALPISHNGSVGQPSMFGNLYWDSVQKTLMVDDPQNGYVVAGGGGSSSGNYPGIPTGNMLADYRFTEGVGSTLSDFSGNGNNGTVTGALWTVGGLSFADQAGGNATAKADLPSALNIAQSYLFVVYLNPLKNSIYPGSYNVLMSNTQSINNLNFVNDSFNQHGRGRYSFTVYRGNLTIDQMSAASNMVSGLHTFIFTCAPTSLPKIYFDGIEVTYNATRTDDCSWMPTSGHYVLGSSTIAPLNGGMFDGVFYRSIFWSSRLTDAQAVQASTAAMLEVNNRGISPISTNPQYSIPQTFGPTGTPTLFCSGDSITAGFGVPNSFCTSTLLTPLLTFSQVPSLVNYGIGGITARETSAAEPNRIALRCHSQIGQNNIATVFLGTNDFQVGGSSISAPDVLGTLQQEISTLTQAGCDVFVATMLSRTGVGSNGATNDNNKNALDGLIGAKWRISGAKGFLDFASNPLLGSDGAYANTTYFQADGIHPTTAGQTLLAGMTANLLNYAYSPYSIQSPKIVTSTGYTMISSDVAVSRVSSSNLDFVNLPDCTGMTGSNFTVTNLSLTNTLALGPSIGSQFISGISTITMSPMSSVSVQATMPSYATGGCVWTRI